MTSTGVHALGCFHCHCDKHDRTRRRKVDRAPRRTWEEFKHTAVTAMTEGTYTKQLRHRKKMRGQNKQYKISPSRVPAHQALRVDIGAEVAVLITVTNTAILAMVANHQSLDVGC